MPPEHSQKCLLTSNSIFVVAYDYDTKSIFALPITNVKDKTTMESFNKVFTKLTEKGHNPTFNVTYNQAVTPLKNISAQKIAGGNL